MHTMSYIPGTMSTNNVQIASQPWTYDDHTNYMKNARAKKLRKNRKNMKFIRLYNFPTFFHFFIRKNYYNLSQSAIESEGTLLFMENSKNLIAKNVVSFFSPTTLVKHRRRDKEFCWKEIKLKKKIYHILFRLSLFLYTCTPAPHSHNNISIVPKGKKNSSKNVKQKRKYEKKKNFQ